MSSPRHSQKAGTMRAPARHLAGFDPHGREVVGFEPETIPPRVRVFAAVVGLIFLPATAIFCRPVRCRIPTLLPDLRTAQMNLAYTMAPGRGDTDLILHRLARELAARGSDAAERCRSTRSAPMPAPATWTSRSCPDGPVLRISQDLGPSARGCRLDPAALERPSGLVSASLTGRRHPDREQVRQARGRGPRVPDRHRRGAFPGCSR